MSLLFYLGIIQKIVYVMGWLFTKFMRLSGAEALCCAGNIFLGQCEAPLMVKEYVPKMTRSELMLVMTCGMSIGLARFLPITNHCNQNSTLLAI